MRAMVIDGFGGADRLHPAEMPAPAAAAGEVLIRVAAAGVNPVDWKIREGSLEALFPHHFPLIPGWDAAGTVAALGDGVEELRRRRPGVGVLPEAEGAMGHLRGIRDDAGRRGGADAGQPRFRAGRRDSAGGTDIVAGAFSMPLT